MEGGEKLSEHVKDEPGASTVSCRMLPDNDKIVLNTIFNPLLPVGESDFEEAQDGFDELLADSKVLEAAKDMELEGVKQAENGNVNEAIDIFSAAIQLAPSHSSAYNNRAQALSLAGKPQEALEDLNKALELSERKGKSACQAFTQRGLIRKLLGQEKDAVADFEEAARLGSSFAKNMLVQLNPYAAMCNKMLSEVIGKLQRGEATVD